MKIDAHQHFWRLDRGDYGWLTPELAPIYRDFLPGDLAPLLAAQGIGGTVLVQAAPTAAETHFMLSLAEDTAFIKGVVGWVDFEADDATTSIGHLAKHPQLVGLRPMIQDIADPDWMLRPSLSAAFDAMIAHGLVFDALTLPHHLPNLLTLLGRHPDLPVVIDHGSKPAIATGAFEDWARDIAAIAAETGAYVKLSGLVTEAGDGWMTADLRMYVEHLLERFGPGRVIWGSDWPVATLASSYDRWCKTTEDLLIGLDQAERDAVWGGNAVALYGLDTSP